MPLEFTSNLGHHNVKLNRLLFWQKFWHVQGSAELLLIGILSTVTPAVVTQVNEVSETSLL